jgi:hypothetical protein
MKPQFTIRQMLWLLAACAVICSWLTYAGWAGVSALGPWGIAGFLIGLTFETLRKRIILGLTIRRSALWGAAYGLAAGMVAELLSPRLGSGLGLLLTFIAVPLYLVVTIGVFAVGGRFSSDLQDEEDSAD